MLGVHELPSPPPPPPRQPLVRSSRSGTATQIWARLSGHVNENMRQLAATRRGFVTLHGPFVCEAAVAQRRTATTERKLGALICEKDPVERRPTPGPTGTGS
jgi:hypothetical protein